MARWKLFYRLMIRPLLHEPVRLVLMVLAVGLGVAVVLAIELAGTAAAGSFRSSMESLAGDNDLEVVASGGVPETVVATLATQPYPLRLSPRMEDFAVDTRTRETLPLIGLDLIAEGSRYAPSVNTDKADSSNKVTMEESVRDLENSESVWVSASLGKQAGEHISLLINDRVLDCVVRGVFPELSGDENAILMDIAGAQSALNRFGRVDRILIKLPANSNLEEWQKRLSGVLPPGVEVRPQGTGTEENRKMLAAFRWNLRLLSYIALGVGAFLIYNTISVSVAQRDWNRAGARRRSPGCFGRVSWRGGMPGAGGRAGGPAAGANHGRRRGEIDGGDGGIAVRKQPAGDDCVDAVFAGAGVADWSGSGSGIGAFAGAGSDAGFAR